MPFAISFSAIKMVGRLWGPHIHTAPTLAFKLISLTGHRRVYKVTTVQCQAMRSVGKHKNKLDTYKYVSI